MKTMSSWQFTLFRIFFSTYLFIHFISLLPYSVELFGHEGLIQNAALNPTFGLFPNPLAWNLSAPIVTTFVGVLAFASLLLTAGVLRPFMAAILWFGWSALFHRNNLIGNPSIPYVGLLLALCVIIPTGEPLSFSKNKQTWFMPKWAFRSAWILLAAGYTFSGFTKLSSPSWVDGSAMSYLLSNPLARPGMIRDLMLSMPETFLIVLTWVTLAAELFFAPLVLFKRTRPWIWLMLVLMHLGIVAVVDFADLSFGMLMIHAFTFDPAWFPARSTAKENVLLAYDGDCLMCSRAIHFFASEDREKILRFIPLQSTRGQTMEARIGSNPLQSMLIEIDGKVSSKSDAQLHLLSSLGGHWKILALAGFLIPRRFRNAAYDFIAQRRHRLFRKSDLCAMPSTAVRERILADVS